MYPILFKIPLFGGIPIYSYGLLVALGFLAGAAWVKREARLTGESPEKAIDLVFIVILGALLGSRVLYFLVGAPNVLLSDPLVFFRTWEGGFVFYGGLLAAVPTALWFIRRHHLPVLKYLDIFAPAIPLGHAIGRFGCFATGCCYGRPVQGHPWYEVIFPVGANGAPPGIPLYPTQLMESAGLLFIFGVLLLLRRRKRFEGQIFAAYLILYPILRSVIELYRGDVERGFVIDPWLSTSQFLSIVVVFFGIGFYLWKERGTCRES